MWTIAQALSVLHGRSPSQLPKQRLAHSSNRGPFSHSNLPKASRRSTRDAVNQLSEAALGVWVRHRELNRLLNHLQRVLFAKFYACLVGESMGPASI